VGVAYAALSVDGRLQQVMACGFGRYCTLCIVSDNAAQSLRYAQVLLSLYAVRSYLAGRFADSEMQKCIKRAFVNAELPQPLNG